jgi:RNA polymerase sigma-70 factor (ECF subfamily)
MEAAWHNDLELVRQACGGDKTAFREIVETNRKKIFFFAYDLTGSQQDAEDLSQEVFLKAFRSLKKFRGQASLSSWFYRITLNTFLDQKRKLSFSAEKAKQELDGQRITEVSLNQPNPLGNPENYAESRQIRLHIEAALERLTPRERSVFVMRHYQGMPVKEAAGLLGISGGTVKSLLFRAIKKLQKELDFYKEETAPLPYEKPDSDNNDRGAANDCFADNRPESTATDPPAKEVYQ